MLNVTAYVFLYGGRVARERLTRARLDHAHASAAAILSGSRRDERAFWKRYALNFMVGAATPLLGNLLLDWPIAFVLVAIAFDNVALCLADLMKASLARESFEGTARRQRSTENVVYVARGMRESRRLRHASKGIKVPILVEADHPWIIFVILQVGVYGLLSVMIALGLFLIIQSVPDSEFDMQTLWWLAVPATLRIASALRDVAVQDGSESLAVRLQPQSFFPMVCLYMAILATAWVAPILWEEDWFRYTLEPYHGSLFLFVYLMVAVVLGWLGLGRLRAAETNLQSFAATDLSNWQDRLRQRNGDE